MTKEAPKRDLTVAELRAAFKAEFGRDHPVFELEWPTVGDASERLGVGLDLFQNGYFLNGGRAGMLVSLQGAIDYLRASLPAKDQGVLAPLTELHRVLCDLEVTGNRASSLSAERRGNPDSEAVADVKSRAIVIGNILKSNTARSRKEADKLAADILSDAAAAVGIADRIDDKAIANWRRGIRSRRTQHAKDSTGSPPELFPRRSLSDRVENVREEMLYKARVLECIDGGVCLTKLIQMILPPIVDMDESSLAILRARVRSARGEPVAREDQVIFDEFLKKAPR